MKAVADVSYPEVGTVTTASVGDHLLKKGFIAEEGVLVVQKSTVGFAYQIPEGKYRQLGFDEQDDFYSAVGVTKSALHDPIQALSVGKQPSAQLCVVTTLGSRLCYDADYERQTQISERGNSFQQTLIYSGRIGNKINVGYREFSSSAARPAFNNDVEYDLSSSKTIGYKGALLEIMDATNSSVTYKVLSNFK
ncbi:hypothetical protein GCM10007242_45250 [Pigmentiphaga litoralis]|uniref:hypothetical protein n=1 Tax=Pigmentiphaga litoralis TaxID=516702 RepID=UPI001986AB0A|nr:hypothetical protein [Pigmentiphaga litoralis]GGX33117.1 hypothetical protein GCM10007242_45250 [Pigmentiphaga litoralis]